ncbi:MAG TPA: hypothetical protein VLT36_21240 [Candidatus Dormibacteraeota bacterium]|nr:hypothetical protein [Candidatus Dormibacteraeota bacterium]
MGARKRWAVILGAAVFATHFFCSGQNLILNGDFENNGASSSLYNLNNTFFNSLVYNATAFGTGEEIDLMTTDSPYGSPQSGLWKAAIHKSGYPYYGNDDAFSFTLSSPAVAGQQYALSFYAQIVPTADNPGNGDVQVGLSGSATSFGALVFAGTSATNDWSHLTATFAAPVDGLYLTVQIDPGANPTWVHIDNFSLTAIPEPGNFGLLCSFGLLSFLFGKRQQTVCLAT